MNLDILKLIVILIAFFYLNFKVKPYISQRNYWLMNLGLCLVIFASVLDFADGMESLDFVPILGRKAPLHDILEDQIADTSGLALFIWGALREIIKSKTKEKKSN